VWPPLGLGTSRRASCFVDGAADRGSGGIHPALGQSQKRQSRFRHPSSLIGFVIGVLGFGELSPEPVELGPLVERRTELRLGRHRQPFAGTPCLVQGIRPRAAQLQDLRPVHHVPAPVGNQIRLRRTPLAQRRRPLLRPPHIQDLLTRLDHAAVDDPSGDRRDLARRDSHHGLVEQHHPLGRLAHPDERTPLGLPRHRHQIRIAGGRADRARTSKRLARTLVVALGIQAQPERYEQPPPLDAVVLAVVEHALGTRKPAAALGPLTPVHQRDAEPKGTPGRSSPVGGAQRLPMRAGPERLAVGILASEVTGDGEVLKIVERERLSTIRGGQLAVRIPPRPPSEGLTTSIERVHCGHRLLHRSLGLSAFGRRSRAARTGWNWTRVVWRPSKPAGRGARRCAVMAVS
jgi:hypothetical protein